MRNLPDYLSDDELIEAGADTSAPLFTSDVLEPLDVAPQTGLWMLLAVIGLVLILPGNKSSQPAQ